MVHSEKESNSNWQLHKLTRKDEDLHGDLFVNLFFARLSEYKLQKMDTQNRHGQDLAQLVFSSEHSKWVVTVNCAHIINEAQIF